MALIALEKLEDQLNCSICLGTYTNPKQLQCHHVYCQKCLVKLVIQDQQGQLSLTCPTCRQVTPVPANGVSGLQAAFRVNQLLEIVEKHKKTSATLSPEKRESVPSSLLPDSLTTVCPEHGRNAVELYCESCEKVICFECIMSGSKHHSHKYGKLSEAFEQYSGELMSLLEPVEKQLKTIEKALAQFDVRYDEISCQRATIEADVHKTIARLYEALDVRKTELISQLHQLTLTKLKSLAAQRDQLETTQAQLHSCLIFMKENFETSSQVKAMQMKSSTVRQVTALATPFQPDMLEPNPEADIVFSTLDNLQMEVQSYGKVYAQDSPDPSKCSVIYKEVGTVGEELVASLNASNFNGQPCKKSVTSISCELLSEVTGVGAIVRVDETGQSQYKIRYQPTIKGTHQLHIMLDNQDITGSPFCVCVSSSVEKLGNLIGTVNDVRSPMGVAINHSGEVVVTEYKEHSVSVLSPGGKRLLSFGGQGSSPGQFQRPFGVAVDKGGNYLIVDNSNHRIQKFSAQGDFLQVVGTRGKGSLQLNYPHGILFNATNNRVYVVDGGNNRVQILNSDLSYYGTFGKKGASKSHFDCPVYAACDSKGRVYVSDCYNHRIQVFTPEGQFVRMFGRRGEGKGELNEPYGVAIDSHDRVYVADYTNRRVSVFTSKGQPLLSFGSNVKLLPQGLAVDSSGVVYVCDNFKECVQLF